MSRLLAKLGSSLAGQQLCNHCSQPVSPPPPPSQCPQLGPHLGIIWLVAVVPTVGPVLDFEAVGQPLQLQQRLVHPVPDEAALRGGKEQNKVCKRDWM